MNFEPNAQTQKLLQAQQAGQTLETRRCKVVGQLMFCQGCCCGQTEKGFPELPRERLKHEWKQRRLNDTIQLTISGCLGPCDLANVCCLVVPQESPQWFGGLHAPQQYEDLIQWAQSCQIAGQLQPLPAWLLARRFERFAGQPAGGCVSTQEVSLTP
jgi:cobaltochelatase CobN